MLQKLQSAALLLHPHLDESSLVLRDRIVEVVGTIQRAGLNEFVPLPNAQSPGMECLFCWCDQDGESYILHVAPDGASSNFRDFVAAIGSGGPFGQVALASAGHLVTFALDLERLKMVAYKAVQDVIITSSFGVGPPIQMYTVTATEGAQQLTSEEVDAVRDAVFAWMEVQRDILGDLAEAPGEMEEVGEAEDAGIEPLPAEEEQLEDEADE
jgi:hypothetical protein